MTQQYPDGRFWSLALENDQWRESPADTVAVVDEALGGYEHTFIDETSALAYIEAQPK